MKKQFALLTACSLLVAGGFSAQACGTGLSTTITNLPALPSSFFQVNGLNSAGQLTGYFVVTNVHGAHAFLYSGGNVTDLNTLGGSLSQGFAINNLGQVAGDSFTSNGILHGFFFDRTNLIDVGTLGGNFSSASGLNDSGQVIGSSILTGGTTSHAFLYSTGAIADIGTLGGDTTFAHAINNGGTVVGESDKTNGETHAVAYSAGVLHDLGTLGGGYSAAFAINDAGLIVGESETTNGAIHAFAYSGGVMTDLGTLGGVFSSASAVNQAGQIIGILGTTNLGVTDGFLYSAGTLTDLGALGSSGSEALAINNSGQIVGSSAPSTSSVPHAVLWQNGVITDLNTRLPSGSPWELLQAQFINDAGRIVGIGVLNGVTQPFILDLATASGTNAPPTANAGPDQSIQCPGTVTLDGSHSSDPDGDALTYEWKLDTNVVGTNSTLSWFFAKGTNVVTLTVTDPCGASNHAVVVITVNDATAPVISHAKAHPAILWPPNHKLVTVEVDVATKDNCDASPTCRIISITANEKTKPSDIQITGALTAKLAASKNANGKGRLYSIVVQCTDAAGNSSTAKVCVIVPKSKKQAHEQDKEDKQASSKQGYSKPDSGKNKGKGSKDD
jgi:probable HAF family extracellular repeat protein